MKYDALEWTFYSIALGFPHPGLSIIPHLHRKYIANLIIDTSKFDKIAVRRLISQQMRKGFHHPIK